MTTTYGSTEHIERMVHAEPSLASKPTDPWAPWSAQVMILAGSTDGIRPWLYLGCRKCGWSLGFAAQYDPDCLAAAAASHREDCKE